MYLMFADEADQSGHREYLVYAAIFVPGGRAAELSTAVAQARAGVGMRTEDCLKFKTRTRPETLTPEAHTQLKNLVLQLAKAHEVKVCCYLVPHDIARNQDLATKLKFGSNVLLQKFNQFLNEQGGLHGVAYFDRTSDYPQQNYLSEVFSKGLDFNGTRRRLQQILCLGTTADGASHIGSVCDIVVGACRYAINEPDRPEAGATLLRLVAEMMWSQTNSEGVAVFRERGLCIRPMTRSVQDYEANIQALLDRLNGYLTT